MKTYTGGCHCKKVHYEVDIESLSEAMSCNCSICSKRGWLLTFAPQSSFRLLSGKDNVTEYRFNKNVIGHIFCKTCGTASYGTGEDPAGNKLVAINVRCLDDIDVQSLKVNEVNGKDF